VTKTIAIFNQAGGVAKTTLTQNLGYHLARRNHRVLLIDMDPQASLTIFMGLNIDALKQTLYDALVDEEPLYIEEDLTGMDLAPTNLTLSAAETMLVNADLRELRLKSAIEPIEEYYDFILIDCPPSLGLLSYISLVASTYVLVPIETEFKAFQGTNKLLETVARVKGKINRHLKIAGFVPTRYDARMSQDTRTLGAIQEQLSDVATIFPPIPSATSFPNAAERHLPLALFDPKHVALKIFDRIADAMEKLP
jgi:chromosome partitioning protein